MANKKPISWEESLRQDLEDPEYAAHFANARQESLKELSRAGVSPIVNLTSLVNKTRHITWRVK